MRFWVSFIICKLLLLLSVHSYGQLETNTDYDNRIETLSTEQGLTANAVSDILQDKDGFLWVGTNTGLNKYDAYQFENFLFEIDDSSSLGHSFVRDMLVDNNGRLWIATWGGRISIFNFEKQTFSSLSKEFNTASHDIHNHVECIHQSKDGSFWLGTLFGLVHFNPKRGSLDKYFFQESNSNSISDNWTIEILERNDGTMLFVGNDGRLNVFNALEKNFNRYEIPKKQGKKELIKITRLFEDASQNLLIGTGNGLYLFDHKKGVFANLISDEITQTALAENPINDMMEYDESSLWLGTNNGMFELKRVNQANDQLSLSGSSRFLSKNSISKIYKDVQGNIWMGTHHSGLKVLYNKKKQFSGIDIENQIAQTIVFDKQNNLWVGTSGGLFQLDKDRKIKKRYTLNSGLSSNTIRSLFAEDKRLLIGTNSGLDVLDLETGVITLWREENNLLNTPIVNIKKDDEGNLWLGSDQKGLVHIDKTSGEVKNYIASSNDPVIGNYNVTSLCFASKNKLWVGIYGGGINLFDIQKREFVKRYLHEPKNESSLNDNNILDIDKDKKGNIWIATADGGLNQFNHQTGSFKAYLKKDGLPSNSIFSIKEDDEENLWIGTHRGLAKFDINSSEIKYFDTSDGLMNNKFEQRAVYKDAEGLLYFGTNRGVVRFNTKEVNENTEEPDLLLTDFKIFNRNIDYNDKKAPLQKHITYTNSVVLKHNQTAITIEYVALNYISSAKNKYAFRMDGLEDEWREVGSQRIANYSNIPAGEYTFMVKASNNDGVWTSEPLKLDIKVLPHPLKSNLAYSIYWVLFLLLNILIIWFVRWFLKRKHQMEVVEIERDTEKQLTQFKLQFFTNISHELRTHLTLIVNPINKLLKKGSRSAEDKNLLNRIDLNVTRLVKLTDEIIDFRKIEQGKTSLVLQKSNIVDFLQEIHSIFNPIAMENEIQIEFQAEQTEISWCYDQEKLKKILFNLLSNAIKYTQDGGWVKLSVELLKQKNESEEKLRIVVEDNGIGIAHDNLPHIFDRFFNPGKDQQQHQSHDSSGIGLALVKQLVELHKGNVYVDSAPGKGSRFYFDLIKMECMEAETATASSDYRHEKYEKWKDIINLERSNLQDELVIDNETKSEDIPVVLVVDDNKEICLALNDLLKDKYNVFVAGHGKKALEIADKENIDLVVSDVMMPVMDGIELCNNLKENIKTSHIPVVLLTAKTGIDNELQGLRTGADSYLTKPFNEEKVLLIVGNILDNRKKIQLFNKGEKPETVKEPVLNPLDKKLIDKVIQIINERISDTGFSVDELGQEAGLSRMHLFRKLKALTVESPSDLIKKTRLEKSKELLEKGELSISDVANDTGFSSPGNFSTSFKKFYGDTPAQHRAKYFKAGV